jgi:predicted RNA-binding protein with PIN domain
VVPPTSGPGGETPPEDDSEELPQDASAEDGGSSALESDVDTQRQTAGVDWDELAAPVRTRLAQLAAAALGRMRKADVPTPLRPVMRFAPAKRAKLGQQPLLAALRDSSVFRQAVLDQCRNAPELLSFEQADPAAVAAAALLLDSPQAAHYTELVAFRAEQGRLRNERDSAVSRADKLAADVERLREELAAAQRAAEQAGSASGAEADRLRKRLREQGVRLREAKDDAAAAREELERARGEVEEMAAQRDRAKEQVKNERTRAERAVADAEVAKQAAREARQGDEVRLSLLLDTVEGALTGLRRELAASGSGPLPADAADLGRSDSGMSGHVGDQVGLERLLVLPAVHLIVDGYNVTKTGYPELPLADQRERLAHQLASLSARTGAEVTVVFDGADVLAVPTAGPRGVRVLFSDPGVQADDVIRALVDAEPQGRQLVVATSDREVVVSVRRRGAYSVSSPILLERLQRV